MVKLYPFLQAAGTAEAVDVVVDLPSVSVVGLGYVGAVSTACLSSLGHRVVGVDVDQTKIEQIAQGVSPIHEKDLGRLLSEGVANNLITTTDDLVQAVIDTDVTFVSVGTPTAADGGCDLGYIRAAAELIGQGIAQKNSYHVVVMRCSIPPGTTMNVMLPIIEEASGKVLGKDFSVCFNPEFLREGVAIEDFYAPPKTVVGATDTRAANVVKQILLPIDPNVIITSIETAEMVKYVDNVWHAAKVVFANEVGRLCKPLGVDSRDVMDVFVQDTKLNLSPYYLKPGFAYGGSCLPKEVRAMAHIAESIGVNLPLVQALGNSNQAHVEAAIRMVRETGAKRVGVLGLSFKSGTDDLRESPILEVIAALNAEGIEILAHDPIITHDTPLAGQLNYVQHASPALQALVDDLPRMLQLSVDDVLEQCDAVIVTDPHPSYRAALAQAETTPILDVIGLGGSSEENPNYEGIGW